MRLRGSMRGSKCHFSTKTFLPTYPSSYITFVVAINTWWYYITHCFANCFLFLLGYKFHEFRNFVKVISFSPGFSTIAWIQVILRKDLLKKMNWISDLPKVAQPTTDQNFINMASDHLTLSMLSRIFSQTMIGKGIIV